MNRINIAVFFIIEIIFDGYINQTKAYYIRIQGNFDKKYIFVGLSINSTQCRALYIIKLRVSTINYLSENFLIMGLLTPCFKEESNKIITFDTDLAIEHCRSRDTAE